MVSGIFEQSGNGGSGLAVDGASVSMEFPMLKPRRLWKSGAVRGCRTGRGERLRSEPCFSIKGGMAQRHGNGMQLVMVGKIFK